MCGTLSYAACLRGGFERIHDARDGMRLAAAGAGAVSRRDG